MSDMRFFGAYAIFKTKNKSEGSEMVGADHLVGREYSIVFKIEEGKNVAWVKNAFGKEIGYFDDQMSYRLDVMKARGWKIRGLLSLVGFTNPEEEGQESYYWGEMALFASPEKYDGQVSAFMGRVAENLIEGIRPDIDLTSSSIDIMLDKNGDWLPDKKMPTFKKTKGTAIVKDRQSLSEKAIEQGRAGNIGCYIVSWAFIIALIAGIIMLTKVIFNW